MLTGKPFTQASGVVEHRRDAVEPEAVEAVDVDPHPQVGQQEPENLPVVVVEQAGVPEGMVAARTRVEETGICQGKVNRNWKRPRRYSSVSRASFKGPSLEQLH